MCVVFGSEGIIWHGFSLRADCCRAVTREKFRKVEWAYMMGALPANLRNSGVTSLTVRTLNKWQLHMDQKGPGTSRKDTPHMKRLPCGSESQNPHFNGETVNWKISDTNSNVKTLCEPNK